MTRRFVRLHSYGSVWHMLAESGHILCGRSMPDSAVESSEPRSPNSYICSRCYRIEANMDPAPQFVAKAEGPSPIAALEERLAALELSVRALSAQEQPAKEDR